MTNGKTNNDKVGKNGKKIEKDARQRELQNKKIT